MPSFKLKTFSEERVMAASSIEDVLFLFETYYLNNLLENRAHKRGFQIIFTRKEVAFFRF